MVSKNGLTRREMLELGVAGGLTVGLGAPAVARDRKPGTRRRSGPKNIVFMVADGMSLGVPTLAEPFSHLVRGCGTRWYELLADPDASQGFFDTCALNSPVTDSSAAVSAWATGSRVFNGALNVLPDGTHLTPIGTLARETGRRVGLVTTTRITYATPAGFAAAEAKREDEDSVAAQYLRTVDVLLGGGLRNFAATRRSDGRDLWGEFGEAGYALWNERAQVLAGKRPQRLLGLFGDSHLPYTIDHRNQRAIAKGVPTLAEMTDVALDILSSTGSGFLLQVEGGRVDHAAHANDAAALLWDQLAFDDAIACVLEFTRREPDTLVIITSDHGCANPGLNGVGADYRESQSSFERIAKATASFEAIIGQLRPKAAGEAPAAPETVQEIARRAFGLELESAQAAAIHDAAAGRLPKAIYGHHRYLTGMLGQILCNHNGVGWTGGEHTEDLVLLSAIGPGAERFQGLMPNTDAFGHMAALWGIRHENPQMSAEEAKKYLAAAPVTRQPHWIDDPRELEYLTVLT